MPAQQPPHPFPQQQMPPMPAYDFQQPYHNMFPPGQMDPQAVYSAYGPQNYYYNMPGMPPAPQPMQNPVPMGVPPAMRRDPQSSGYVDSPARDPPKTMYAGYN